MRSWIGGHRRNAERGWFNIAEIAALAEDQLITVRQRG
jgi:hypothetical protein